jgi:hypothetical protein
VTNLARADTKEKFVRYDAQLQAKDAELETMRRELFTDAKMHPSKKRRKQAEDVRQKLASQSDLHDSPNTVRQISDLEKHSLEDGDQNVKMVWAFVFNMPEGSHTGLDPDEEGDDMADDLDNEGNDHVPHTMRVSHEAWMCCEKILASDLCMKHVIPIDGRHLIVAVGARHKILVEEAEVVEMLMRMQETKGAFEFHPDLIRFYSSNHGGLNEFQSGNWQRRDASEMATHWKPDEQLNELQLEIREERSQAVFTSAQCHRLVRHRLKRLGRYDPDHIMQLASRPGADARVLSHISNRAVTKHRTISASLLHDVLVLFGGYR